MRAVLPCVLVLLLQSPAAAQDLLVTDVQKLANSQNNDDRFAALTGILRDRGVTFTVKTFALDKPAGGSRAAPAGTSSPRLARGEHRARRALRRRSPG